MPNATPVWIMFAVTPDKRQSFANCFTGNVAEASIRLRDKSTGLEWWGVNGAYYFETEINRTCLNAAQAWFCASNPNSGTVIETNAGFTVGGTIPTFAQFLTACNLEYWPANSGGGGNMTTSP